MQRRQLAPLVLALLATLALPALAQRGDDANRKSKNGRLEATIGGVPVVIDYGRPQVRGREIWGALVPYGQVWRTGADEATTIAFTAPSRSRGRRWRPAGTRSSRSPARGAGR
jgi:hypothetical protein